MLSTICKKGRLCCQKKISEQFEHICLGPDKAPHCSSENIEEKNGSDVNEGTENLTIFRRNYIASSKKTAQIHFLNARVVFFTIFIGLLF
ncbi:hypothetical protein, partial [Brevibacillus laterosporus]